MHVLKLIEPGAYCVLGGHGYGHVTAHPQPALMRLLNNDRNELAANGAVDLDLLVFKIGVAVNGGAGLLLCVDEHLGWAGQRSTPVYDPVGNDAPAHHFPPANSLTS